MPNTVNLYFKVTKQEVQRIDTETVASGALNTLVANFDFCEVWSGLYKFCRFEGAGGILDVAIDDETSSCVIPWEVIEAPNFTMACYGTRSTDVILTTKKLSVKVYQSINFIEDEPLPETPKLIDMYSKLAQHDLSDLVTESELDSEKTARINAVNMEASTRANADTTLQNNISAEASARAAADSVLDARIDNIVQPGGKEADLKGTKQLTFATGKTVHEISFGNTFSEIPTVDVQIVSANYGSGEGNVSLTVTETTTSKFKVTAINNYANSINANVKWTAWTGSETLTELTDIRVGYDGKTYATAGEAVRGSDEKLSGEIEELNSGLAWHSTHNGTRAKSAPLYLKKGSTVTVNNPDMRMFLVLYPRFYQAKEEFNNLTNVGPFDPSQTWHNAPYTVTMPFDAWCVVMVGSKNQTSEIEVNDVIAATSIKQSCGIIGDVFVSHAASQNFMVSPVGNDNLKITFADSTGLIYLRGAAFESYTPSQFAVAAGLQYNNGFVLNSGIGIFYNMKKLELERRELRSDYNDAATITNNLVPIIANIGGTIVSGGLLNVMYLEGELESINKKGLTWYVTHAGNKHYFETSGQNLYWKPPAGSYLRGKISATFNAWDTKWEDYFELVTSPNGVDGCILIQHNKKLVWNYSNNSVEIIDLLNFSNKENVVILAVSMGEVVGGVAQHEYLKFLQESADAELNIQIDSLRSDYELPDYWSTYMNTKDSEITNQVLSAGANGDSFVFVTDVHWAGNAKKSPALIKHIINKTPVEMCVFGGDILDMPTSHESAVDTLSSWRNAVDFADIFTIRGNHDGNTEGGDYTNQITDGEFYAMFTKQAEKHTNTNGNLFYCVDNDSQKIRYIFLDTKHPDSAVMEDSQVNWMKQRVNELESGWNVVVFMHQLFSPKVAATDTDGILTIDGNGTKVINALNSIYDSANATIVAIIAGHCHRDYSVVSDKGYPCIATTCDAVYGSAYWDNVLNNRAKGNTSEQAFDVFTIDTDNRTIKAKRIGAGSDRNWTY